MPHNNLIFNDYAGKHFVETGSFLGDGIQEAIEAGFENIISIEILECNFNICKNRFSNNENVKLFNGDSSIILYDIIKNINDKIVFWLDAHYSGESVDGGISWKTGKGETWCPLLEELKQIKQHLMKNHTILIDDLRDWRSERPQIGFGVEDLKRHILEINKNYKFYFLDGHIPKDILVAEINQ